MSEQTPAPRGRRPRRPRPPPPPAADDVASLRREAASHRVKAKEAAEQRDALAARVETMQRREAERLAAAQLATGRGPVPRGPSWATSSARTATSRPSWSRPPPRASSRPAPASRAGGLRLRRWHPQDAPGARADVRRHPEEGRGPMTPDEAVAQLAQLVTVQLAGDAVAFNEAVAELDEDGAKFILGAAVAVMAQACGDSLLAQLDA